jgi:hypothetical protein
LGIHILFGMSFISVVAHAHYSICYMLSEG